MKIELLNSYRLSPKNLAYLGMRADLNKQDFLAVQIATHIQAIEMCKMN